MTITLEVGAAPGRPALHLRPWRDADTEALIDAYGDARMRMFSRHAIADERTARTWLDIQREGWATGARLSFAVLIDGESEDAPAGYVAVKRSDLSRTTGEVGYWVAARARGQSIAPRALHTVSAWALSGGTGTALTRLDLIHAIDNDPSCRVAVKTGYRYRRDLPPDPPEFTTAGHLHIVTPESLTLPD